MKKLLILGATIAAALSVGVSTSAAAGVNPQTGLCGAFNMVNDNALPGMITAMGPDFSGPTPQGSAGMFKAVALTGCS